MNFISLLKSGNGVTPITDLSNPPEQASGTAAGIIRTDKPAAVKVPVDPEVAALISINSNNTAFDHALLRIVDSGAQPVPESKYISILPGIKERLAKAAGGSEVITKSLNTALHEIEGVARGLLFESLYAFTSGEPMSYPYLDYVLTTLLESVDRTIIIVSTSPKFRNINGNLKIWVPELEERIKFLKSQHSPVNSSLMIDLIAMEQFDGVSLKSVTAEQLENRYNELEAIDSQVLKDLLSLKLLVPVPGISGVPSQFRFTTNLSWITAPFADTAGLKSLAVNGVDYTKIYSDIEKIRAQYKDLYSRADTSDIYSDDDSFYVKYMENASDSDTLVYKGYVASMGAMKLSARGDSILEATLSDLRNVYDGAALLPFEYIQNRPVISTKEPKGVNGTAKFGLGYWQSTILGTGNWKQLGQNMLDRSLITPITTYANNLSNSVMSAAADAVNMITDAAGNALSDLSSGIMSWATGKLRGLAGQSSGRDNEGKSLLLADDDSQRKQLLNRGTTSGAVSNLASKAAAGLKKYTPNAMAAFDNALAAIKNTLRTSVGATGEARRSGKDTDRFSYWRCYSSSLIQRGLSWNTSVATSGVDEYRFGETESLAGTKSFFDGYSDLVNLAPRIDRYDIRVDVPAEFYRKGMPKFFSSPSTKPMPQYSVDTKGGMKDSFVLKRTNSNVQNPQSSVNLSWQSDLGIITGLALYAGEPLSLGPSGEVPLLSTLKQITTLSMNVVEDADLSVRTWMERYLLYMYDTRPATQPHRTQGETNGSMTGGARDFPKENFVFNPNNFVPTVSRPIFQGYYYITFYLFNSMKDEIQRKRIYYGVPRFDMSLQPSTSGPKVFGITWDIIGEQGIYGGDVSNIGDYSTRADAGADRGSYSFTDLSGMELVDITDRENTLDTDTIGLVEEVESEPDNFVQYDNNGNRVWDWDT